MSRICQDKRLEYAFNFQKDVMNGSMTEEAVLDFFKKLMKDDKLEIWVFEKKINCRALMKGKFKKEKRGKRLTEDQLETVPNEKYILVMFPKNRGTSMKEVAWAMQGVNKLGLFSYKRKNRDHLFFVEQETPPSKILSKFEVEHFSGVGDEKIDRCNKRRQLLVKILPEGLSRIGSKYLPSYLIAAVNINRALGLKHVGQNVSEFLLLLQIQ